MRLRLEIAQTKDRTAAAGCLSEAARLPAAPGSRNHGLKGLPVDGSVFLAGCARPDGRQITGWGLPARGLCVQAVRRPAFLCRMHG